MAIDHKSLRVNGVQINVVDKGTGGPTLIFLHYWGGSTRTWAACIDELSKDHRCVAIDFRGWGLSDKDATDYGVEAMAEDVLGVIDQLGLTDFVIVGHSMGGKIAQVVAARQLPELNALVLVEPAPPTPLQVPEQQKVDMIEFYQSREGVHTAIQFLAKLPLTEAQREQVVEDVLRGAPAAKQAWVDSGMLFDATSHASSIRVPVRVIVGGADPVEPEGALRSAFGKFIPNADFVVIPGVGHLAPLEAKRELVDEIRAALAS
jgi:pimeloyl-ACP methyl ester carboxylesterase